MLYNLYIKEKENMNNSLKFSKSQDSFVKCHHHTKMQQMQTSCTSWKILDAFIMKSAGLIKFFHKKISKYYSVPMHKDFQYMTTRRYRNPQ